MGTMKTDSSGNIAEESDVSEVDSGLSEHHPGCYPTSTYTLKGLHGSTKTCIKKCNSGCYASGIIGGCKRNCFKSSLLEVQATSVEESGSNLAEESDVSEGDAGLSEHHPGCYPTSTYTRKGLHGSTMTCIQKCNSGCYASGMIGGCKKYCFKSSRL